MANKLETNEDLAIFASYAVSAWEACAAKVDALRAYFEVVDDE